MKGKQIMRNVRLIIINIICSFWIISFKLNFNLKKSSFKVNSCKISLNFSKKVENLIT